MGNNHTAAKLTSKDKQTLGKSATSEYKVNYVRPAIGGRLIARSTVLCSGKRQATCQYKVYAQTDDEEKLVAASLGTITHWLFIIMILKHLLSCFRHQN